VAAGLYQGLARRFSHFGKLAKGPGTGNKTPSLSSEDNPEGKRLSLATSPLACSETG